MEPILRLSWVASVALLATTVAGAQTPPLRAQIETLIGAAACTRDDQCRTIGIGSRSCGGPESYRAWSIAATDESALIAAAGRFAAEQARINEKLGLMSTCVILPEPAVACVRRAGAASSYCELATAGVAQQGIR